MMRMDRVSRETQKNGLAEPAAECSKTRDHKTSAAKVLLRLFQDRHSQSRGRQPLVARNVLYMILLVARSHHDTSIVLDLLLRQGSSSRPLCFCWPHLAISAVAASSKLGLRSRAVHSKSVQDVPTFLLPAAQNRRRSSQGTAMSSFSVTRSVPMQKRCCSCQESAASNLRARTLRHNQTVFLHLHYGAIPGTAFSAGNSAVRCCSRSFCERPYILTQ